MKTIQLNRAVLQNIYCDSQNSMIEVFSEFIAGYPEIRKTLFSAFESGNLRSLKRVLHFHGPSFNYLGLPEVAGIFNNLKLKCSQVDNHFSLSKDFAALMQNVDESWLLVKDEMEYLMKAV